LAAVTQPARTYQSRPWAA